jgi:release factor glutamine methyltransferase
MKIQSALIKGVNILKAKFIKTAQLDAEILMGETLGANREYIILNNNKDLEEKKLKNFQNLINERANRKPIAYLLNNKYFWKSKFYVNEHSLIPRPDSEVIIEQVLKISKNRNKLRLLDIGVGSGCILLSILKERKNFYGTGIDISKNSLNICKINAKKLLVENRTKLYKSDVDKFAQGKYDLIVSNPPYIKRCDLKYLESDILSYEPKLALDGGLDGLSVIRKVIKKSSELIKQNGKLILEIGSNQKNKVIKLLNKKGFYINSTIKDFAKNDRCIVSTKI